jgi:hypothetical protein
MEGYVTLHIALSDVPRRSLASIEDVVGSNTAAILNDLMYGIPIG